MKEFSALCLCGLIIGAGVVNAGPVGVAPDPEFDFGTVREGSRITHEFLLKNTGDAPLEIIKIRTGCNSCMTVLPDTKSIPAGGSIGITAELRTPGMAGVVRKMFVVETNVPGSEPVPFVLKGEVTPLYKLTGGRMISLGRVQAGKPREWTFDFSPTALGTCAVTRIEAPPGFAAFMELNVKKSTHHLVLSCSGSALKQGMVRGVLRLFTDSQDIPEFDIPVTALVVGPIIPFPMQVVFPLDQAIDLPVKRMILLRGDPPAPFRVTGIESPTPAIAATPVSAGPNATVRVVVVLSAVLPVGEQGKLVLHTDAPGSPEVRVPVYVAHVYKPAAKTAVSTTTAPTATPVAHPLALEDVLAAVGRLYGRDPGDLASSRGKDEAADMAAWLATRFCSREDRAELRRRLGGISLVRYARARDKIALGLARDPELAARCQEIVRELTGSGGI